MAPNSRSSKKATVTVCGVWMLSKSNVHITTDRAWFGNTEYTPYTSTIGAFAVAGFGTVELPVKRKPKGSGRVNHGTLRLMNVLHVPDAPCNFLSEPLLCAEYDFVEPNNPNDEAPLVMKEKNRLRRVVYFVKRRVKTRKAEETSHLVFRRGLRIKHLGDLHWDNSERDRWEASVYQRSFSSEYPPAELAWIVSTHGDEECFWAAYGMEGTRDEKRKEGLMLARVLLRAKSKGLLQPEPVLAASNSQVVSGKPEKSGPRPKGGHQLSLPIRQAAHRKVKEATTKANGRAQAKKDEAVSTAPDAPAFTAQEKAWLKKHWGDEFKFLRAHGLSIYKEADREEGRRIMRAVSVEDESKVEEPAEDDYTLEEKMWLKKIWGDEDEFLRAHGLSIKDKAQRVEGRIKARALIRDGANGANSDSDADSDAGAGVSVR